MWADELWLVWPGGGGSDPHSSPRGEWGRNATGVAPRTPTCPGPKSTPSYPQLVWARGCGPKQFMKQEPGSSTEVCSFAASRFKTTFPIMDKPAPRPRPERGGIVGPQIST